MHTRMPRVECGVQKRLKVLIYNVNNTVRTWHSHQKMSKHGKCYPRMSNNNEESQFILIYV